MNDEVVEVSAKEKYALAYIQKQETFALEMVRKSMNLEMTIDNLKSVVKTKENEITSAQETLMHQNEIQLQITESIKTLTNERDALREEKDAYIKASKERDRLKVERDETLNKVEGLQNERDALREEKDAYIKVSKERDRLKAERDETLNKVESLQREITRVNSEMQMVWDENQALKNLERFEDGGKF